jgi:copper chaperone CopZ
MAEHNYKFNITMTCGGCSGAVERVLKKLDGKSHKPHSHPYSIS